MTTVFKLLTVALLVSGASAQELTNATWTWVSGYDKSPNQAVYGTKGIASSENVPGHRSQSVSWIDSGGALWLFGGNGLDANGVSGRLNDLWKFDGVNWTWVSGADVGNQNGVYGTKGTADSMNVPGSRTGAVSWVDGGDNLWLFGGSGYATGVYAGDLNDLWKFDGTHWMWVSGGNITNQIGVYGEQGVAESMNFPGARVEAVSWIDVANNFWLFGGYGQGGVGGQGMLNDLWKFDGMNWTWVSGANRIDQNGTFGEKGVSSSLNLPNCRYKSMSWIDSNDNLWLFGGTGRFGVYLNDLWRFDGMNWTWISGANTSNQLGVYGTKGIASSTNFPGARYSGASWVDTDNNVWLFGGQGYSSISTPGSLSDLWKFNGINWTWVSGSNSITYRGNSGTKGVSSSSNAPCSRGHSVSWTDANNNLWLFGGYGATVDNSGGLSDLWMFDGMNWTWVSGFSTFYQQGVYGMKNITSSLNLPSSRFDSVSWADHNDNLWLFGGTGLDSTGSMVSLNDLWKYDGMDWTWISGSNTGNQGGVYGIKGVSSSTNIPGARTGALSWVDTNNNLWLFGGYAFGFVNDLWKFDGVNWTWVSGANTPNQYGIYGVQGTPSSTNVPGGRRFSNSWIDSTNNLWLFGGQTIGYLNDFWKYDGVNWTWISGSNITNQNGAYGEKGVALSSNVPGSRMGAISWTDSDNNFWLFGGQGYDVNGNFDHLNDLWIYNGVNWIWISGNNTVNQKGIYGVIGISDSTNVPGARMGAISWIDSYDNLWLFGGKYSYYDSFNDLWKFDGTNWTWISGANTTKQTGIYGTMKVPSSVNTPGARQNSISWIDSNEILWLFGGFGYSSVNIGNLEPLNDLWRFDGLPPNNKTNDESTTGTTGTTGEQTTTGTTGTTGDHTTGSIGTTGEQTTTGTTGIFSTTAASNMTVDSSANNQIPFKKSILVLVMFGLVMFYV